MRVKPFPLFLAVAIVLGLGSAYAYFQATAPHRYEASRQVLRRRSELRAGLEVRYDVGPIAEEAWRLADIDGVSHADYRILGRSGTQITIGERPRATLAQDANVAFLFQQLVLDGVWDLTSKPPRGDLRTHYAVDVAQVDGAAHGSRRVAFTDPRYWATTGGHQYHITLSRDKPVPNLLQLSSTTLVEPRYEKVIADFRAFGAPGFRAKIEAARKRIADRA